MRRPPLILLAAAATAVLAGGWFAIEAGAQPAQLSPPQTSTRAAELDSFEQRVREYLLKNPEVIMEALQILQQRQRAAEAENLKRTIAERRGEILNDLAAPVDGNPAGDFTLVEFFDYNCPYCRRVAPTVTELEEADPGLRLIYKEFPILGPGSEFAARAALASRRQGKYVAFHNALMQATEQVTDEIVMEVMYPDVVVTCRALAPDDDRVPDPTVVVEVLSPTTQRHDRIAKWREYQKLGSLQHFVLVEQSERRVEVYTRTDTGWALASVEPPGDAVELRFIGARLSLEAIYQGSGR